MRLRFSTAMRKVAAVTRALNRGTTRLIRATLASTAASAVAPSAKRVKAVAKATRAAQSSATSATPKARKTVDGSFSTRSFACAAGARDYKLFVPTGRTGAPRGLIVMLHGCSQDPDDFATGTRMNRVAAAKGLIVAYPAQTRAHNPAGCWNWFQARDQARDAGEPAILAGIARRLMTEFKLERRQVFVAGLSAGGAMAVILAETYPDVFSAAGVHSGLPYQSASTAVGAMAAMRRPVGWRRAVGPASGVGDPGVGGPGAAPLPVRTIIFHGSADRTVHPSNANGIADDAAAAGGPIGDAVMVEGVAKGRRYTRSVITSPGGPAMLENWTIEGIGHAWSGGSRAGSFTDPRGPNASVQMVRFFLAGSATKRGRTRA